MEQGAHVLIVAGDNRLAQSLQALLLAAPHVASARIVGDPAEIETAAAAQTAALVVVAPDSHMMEAVARVRSVCPAATCLALAADSTEREAALAAGAERAYVRGYPAAQLYQAIAELLTQASLQRATQVPSPGAETIGGRRIAQGTMWWMLERSARSQLRTVSPISHQERQK